MNRTIFQFFHWYNTTEENLWQKVAKEAKNIARLGITDVWLPPAYKSAFGASEPGYAVYDLYDLGEFDQKESVRTRYGTKDEYLKAIKALQDNGIQVLADIVLNHKMGGDEKEQVEVVNVKEDNRKERNGDPYTAEAYTKFTFPGRKGKYSSYVWDHQSFTGFKEGDDIQLILNEYTNGNWDNVLGSEKGNYDYLMGMDVEFRNPFVREELQRWGTWYVETTGINGFRLDGLKHINPAFFPDWLDFMKNHFQKDFETIGEYWQQDAGTLQQFIDATGGRISLFDVPLHYNFHAAAQNKSSYDMGSILNNSLIKANPFRAITFVENHDTQPLQALESSVDVWFKPMAGAIILLRQEGIPCVSYPALFGAHYEEEKEGHDIKVLLDKIYILPLQMYVRSNLAYGNQRDYFDHKNIVGWTREGIEEMEYSGIAVLLNNADEGEKWMSMGENNKGRKMVDVGGCNMPDVLLNEKGEGMFKVAKENLSIYVDERAREKMK